MICNKLENKFLNIQQFEFNPTTLTIIDQITENIYNMNRNISILIFTDSNDVDGIAGGVIDYLILKQIGFNNIKIFGSNDRATIPNENYDLIITNDVGINIDWSKNTTSTIIITDHHIQTLKHNQPNVFEIVMYDVCGAYISYFVMSKLMDLFDFDTFDVDVEIENQQLKEIIFEYAVLATIADCMPINSINHDNIGLLYHKIQHDEIKSEMLKMMLKDCYGFDDDTISFGVIPKLNAPMKINNSSVLTGEYFDPVNGVENWQIIMKFMINPTTEIYGIINEINENRKSIVNDCYQSIIKDFSKIKFEQTKQTGQTKFFNGLECKIRYTPYLIEVGISVNSHITGLIASKLTEYYHVPVIVNGKYHSSIRGNDSLEILKLNHNNLKAYGGHLQAAGFKLKDNSTFDLNVYQPQVKKIETNYIDWEDDFNYNQIKCWIFKNMPFVKKPLFRKHIIIQRIDILKNTHSKIFATDGNIYMYFFNILNLKKGSGVDIIFKIGTSNIIVEFC